MDGLSERTILGEGRYLRLVKEGRWEFVQRHWGPSAVAIVAVTAERRLVLVEQFRVPLGRRCIELPAGLVGDEGDASEEFAVAAKRELLEETGYEAGQLSYLTIGPSSAGMADEMVAFYRASELVKIGPGGGDASESISVHEIPLDDVPHWLDEQAAAGAAIDFKIFAALYFIGQTTT